MEKLNFDKKTLRKFGVIMGTAFLVIALAMFIMHKQITLPIGIIAAVFFIVAFIIPALLKPFYCIWMRLAFILGWINTRIILMIIFYLIFTPIGILMKLFSAYPLDLKIEKQKKSYWHKKETKAFNPLDYERQF